MVSTPAASRAKHILRGRRLFRGAHGVPSADGPLRLMGGGKYEGDGRLFLSYLKKHFNASNCEEKGGKEGGDRGGEEEERERKERKLDHEKKVAEQQPSKTLC